MKTYKVIIRPDSGYPHIPNTPTLGVRTLIFEASSTEDAAEQALNYAEGRGVPNGTYSVCVLGEDDTTIYESFGSAGAGWALRARN